MSQPIKSPLAAARTQLSAGLIAARNHPPWRPLPHQIPPPGFWRGWLLLGGRFAGKTDAGAAYMIDHVNGPPCMYGAEPHRMAIVAPTLDDASYSCFEGPSGIKAHEPRARKVTQPGGTIIHFPNGAYAKLFGTDSEKQTDRLRAGGNNCFVWAEEIAAWRWIDLAWAHMLLGLRIGAHPRWVGTTTPKPRDLIKDLDKGKYRNVVVTHATSYDNPHVADDVREDLILTYGGTSLGEQELMGRIVEQDPSALWKRDQIAKFRLTPEQAPLEIMSRIVVGVDPSGGAGEQGIIIVGFSDVPVFHPEHTQQIERGFVLADYSCKLPPDAWGDRAIQAAMDFEATDIVYESNYGRDMPAAVLNGAAKRAELTTIPIRPALATISKKGRAYPVAQKATQGRYPHVGVFPELEDQLCLWTEEAKQSPDRMDAMVWPAWYTKFVSTIFNRQGSMSGGLMAGRNISGRP